MQQVLRLYPHYPVSRKYHNSIFEICVGIENLTNYRQKNPILAWDDPFRLYFDSSIIWGQHSEGGFILDSDSIRCS